MNKLLVLIAFFGFTSGATEYVSIAGLGSAPAKPHEISDNWCENHSGRNGDIYAVCGVGHGMDESAARQAALRLGLDEFARICQMSDDCRERPRTIDVGRTACEIDGRGSYICHRLISVTLLH